MHTTLSPNQKYHDRAKKILQQIPLDHVYHYEILQTKHINRVVPMFTRAFCDAEPMTHYVKMEYHPFSLFALAVTEKAADDGLSIVALDGDRVIACALVEDLMNPLPFTFEVDPKFKYIFSLLEKLSSEFFAGKKFGKNHIAHLFITAVDNDYRGKGLSKQINFRAMARAADLRYAFMLSELTNYYNERGIMKHLLYNRLLLHLEVYQDYTFEGVRPFENLLGSATGYLWELYPDAKLTYEEGNEKEKRLLSTFL